MNIEIINQTYIRILTYDWLSELMNEKSKTINKKVSKYFEMNGLTSHEIQVQHSSLKILFLLVRNSIIQIYSTVHTSLNSRIARILAAADGLFLYCSNNFLLIKFEVFPPSSRGSGLFCLQIAISFISWLKSSVASCDPVIFVFVSPERQLKIP